ncbi:MAG: ABC transporter permease [Verrucomicrobia bacterium]|nr:ABC transporter permease [Verrucomicrobiota bacterium]
MAADVPTPDIDPGDAGHPASDAAPTGGLVGGGRSLTRLGAFTLITLATARRRLGENSRVVRPRILGEIHRCGVRLLPLVGFLGVVLGVVFVGQTASLMEQIGAGNFTGTLMVAVFLREMVPMTAALVVLARVGTAAVIDLGTARALGEVEALEALGIDPIHYLVVPRVVGFAVSVASLGLYLLVVALGSGHAFAYARGLRASPIEFLTQVAGALHPLDFPLIALKTGIFGAFLGLVICYEGLARPLTLAEVGAATTRSVATCAVGCLLVDAAFLAVYLLL